MLYLLVLYFYIGSNPITKVLAHIAQMARAFDC